MCPIDYTSFNAGEPSTDSSGIQKRWWLAKKEERAQAIASIVRYMAQYDSRRATQYQLSTRLYGNTNLMGVNGLSYAKITSVQSALKDRVSYNVIQSTTDTITAKIAKNKPKPLFLTSGGDYEMQRKAKKLDKFVDGIFYENDAYHLGTSLFRDACVFGDGLVHVFDHYDRVKFERVLASEMYVDWVEAFYGHPRQMHRVKNVDRDLLVELFPSKKRQIMDASSATADMVGTYQNVADVIPVVESWHLPSGPEATDGIHCIIIENATLFEEKWEKDYFPFARIQWTPRMYGYWSQGLAEQLQNIQLEINKLLWVIQRSMHLGGSFKVFVENGSKIVKEHLNNDIGAIVSYNGKEPTYLTPPMIQPELYQHLQTLKNSAYELAGISQLSAAAQKPAGLNSGKALREFNDIESERYMTIGQEYERFYINLGKLAVNTAKDIYARKKEYKVRVPGKKFIQTIDWKDVDLEDDEYIMKIFPVSSLPQDPAGRLQTIQEYTQAGMISPRTARRLLDFPDLEQVEDLQNSEEEYMHQILEKMTEQGIYTPPEPYDDLSLARELALEYYAQGKLNNLEESKLDLLRRFIDQTNLLTQQALQPPPGVGQQMPGAPGQTPQQPVPAGGVGQPQASPQAMPQSELLPNVPGTLQ